MKALWRKLAGRYAALSGREQALVGVALLGLIATLIYAIWVQPAQALVTGLRARIGPQQSELASLQAQTASLQTGLRDESAAGARALAASREELQKLDERLGRVDSLLVPPQRMVEVLQAVLAHHAGLSLVSLRSLPPQPLIAAGKDEGGGAGKGGEGKEAGGKERVVETLYRHGLEVRIAGGYADLLAYVAELERDPRGLSLTRVAFTVVEHPKAELTLTVQTLSREQDWLAL